MSISPTRLIIARHGNTFRAGETPTRVGARTDLPLTDEGENQALRLGHHFKAQGILPDLVHTSTLRRTIDTARLACLALGCTAPHEQAAFLNEIDYGPDENKPEPDVVARHGEAAMREWDTHGVMPSEWSPRPTEILLSWKNFLATCAAQQKGKTILAVTSNGIARFALTLSVREQDFPLKLSTGAYGILDYDGAIWRASGWNIKPS